MAGGMIRKMIRSLLPVYAKVMVISSQVRHFGTSPVCEYSIRRFGGRDFCWLLY